MAIMELMLELGLGLGGTDVVIIESITELVLGLAAWGLGLAALLLRKKANAAQVCAMGSLGCCASSLCLVIFGLAHYADIEDVSAFLDTANAFRLCAGVLLLGTLLLNAAALIARFWSRDTGQN